MDTYVVGWCLDTDPINILTIKARSYTHAKERILYTILCKVLDESEDPDITFLADMDWSEVMREVWNKYSVNLSEIKTIDELM